MIFNETYQKSAYNGLYSITELDNMILNQGYVPVATVDEFTNFRNSATQSMGAGTRWAGSYATGMDKKYVQVRNLDFVNVANFLPIGLHESPVVVLTPFTGVYDGNNLYLQNLNYNRLRIKGQSSLSCGIFCYFKGVLICNIRLRNINAIASGTNINNGTLIGEWESGNINNIQASNINSRGHQRAGGLVGICKLTTGVHSMSKCCVIDSTIDGEYNSHLIAVVSNETTTYNGTLSINKCFSSNCNQINGITSGSIIGYAAAINGYVIVENTYSQNSTIRGTTYTGGLIGWLRYNRCSILNSFSANIVELSTNAGGVVGLSSGVITNTYYDEDISGMSDTGKGLPRTTAQMQQGTADSTIGGEAMYTGWDSAIWDFGDSNDYPILK